MIRDLDHCFACSQPFSANEVEEFSMCGHIFHNACWKGSCTHCTKQKELKEKQISEENWSAVKTTVILSLVICAFRLLQR